MAGRQGFSGIRPPDDRGRRLTARRERLVRMAPPANDNRSHGLNLGRLRFTGLRLLLAMVATGAAVALLLGTGGL